MTPTARTFIATNLAQLCVEVVQMRKIGVATGTLLAQLAQMLPIPYSEGVSLPLATTMVEQAAMLTIVAQAKAAAQGKASSDPEPGTPEHAVEQAQKAHQRQKREREFIPPTSLRNRTPTKI